MFVEGERVRVNATHIFLVYIMILFGLAQGLGLIATLRVGDYARSPDRPDECLLDLCLIDPIKVQRSTRL